MRMPVTDVPRGSRLRFFLTGDWLSLSNTIHHIMEVLTFVDKVGARLDKVEGAVINATYCEIGKMVSGHVPKISALSQ